MLRFHPIPSFISSLQSQFKGTVVAISSDLTLHLEVIVAIPFEKVLKSNHNLK